MVLPTMIWGELHIKASDSHLNVFFFFLSVDIYSPAVNRYQIYTDFHLRELSIVNNVLQNTLSFIYDYDRFLAISLLYPKHAVFL